MSLGVLVVRAGFSLGLMTHGWSKLCHFETLANGGFPDPLGWGSALSVCLAIFAELICSALVLLGFLHRLALLPMIATMAVAFFVQHGGRIDGGEMSLLYFVAFVALLLTGPGRFSVDAILA